MYGSGFSSHRQRPRILRQLAAVALVALIASSCSDGESNSDAPVETVDETPIEEPTAAETPIEEPTVAETPIEEPTVAETPVEEPTATAEGLVNPDLVKVELRTGELVVDQTVLAAGLINFEASNFEETLHVFAIARGDSYESLPKLSNGAVDREALGEDFIVKTGLLIEGLGNVRVVSVDLAPGNYVLYCNGGDDEDEIAHVSVGEALTISVVG